MALIVTMATPASALTSHTNTLLDGSVIDIENGRAFELVGDPQCSDGVDNDEDTVFDAPAVSATPDSDCDAEVVGAMRPATEDDNECQNGFQAESAAPTLTFMDDGSGALSAFNVIIPAADVCASNGFGGQFCFRIAITVNSASATGTVSNIVANTSADTTAGPFVFTVAVSTCGHHTPPFFSATNCKVTFSNVNFSTTHSSPRGAAYDGVTYTESGGVGQGTLATRIPSGPSFASGSCGGFINYATQLNSNLGLPEDVDVVLNGETVPDLSSV